MRTLANVRVHKGLHSPLRTTSRPAGPHDRRRQRLWGPLGPVPTPQNETSGNRFVRRPPLAIRYPTITYRAGDGTRTRDVQLGKEAEKQDVIAVRANSPPETSCLVRSPPRLAWPRQRRMGPEWILANCLPLATRKGVSRTRVSDGVATGTSYRSPWAMPSHAHTLSREAGKATIPTLGLVSLDRPRLAWLRRHSFTPRPWRRLLPSARQRRQYPRR
jgi:hypothetical protein